MTAMRSNPKPRPPYHVNVASSLEELAIAVRAVGLGDEHAELRAVIDSPSTDSLIFRSAVVKRAHFMWLLGERAPRMFAELTTAFEAVLYVAKTAKIARFADHAQMGLVRIGDLNIAADLASKWNNQGATPNDGGATGNQPAGAA